MINYLLKNTSLAYLKAPIKEIPSTPSSKFYVYRQKLFHEGDLDICQWLLEFKMKLQAETWIRKRIGSRPLSRSLA